LPDNQAAFDGMSPGWSRVLQRVENVAAQHAAASPSLPTGPNE